MPGHRYNDSHSGLLDRMFDHFTRNHMLVSLFSALAAVLAMVSLFTSVVMWLAVYTLPSASPLEALAGQIRTAAYILLPVCAILTLLLALFQHRAFHLGAGVLMNLIIMWFAFAALLLKSGSVTGSMQLNSMVGTLLSVVLALFGGFFFAALPSVLIACAAAAIHKLLDLILPT